MPYFKGPFLSFFLYCMQKKEIVYYYYTTLEVLILHIINLRMEKKPIYDILFHYGGSFEKYFQKT